MGDMIAKLGEYSPEEGAMIGSHRFGIKNNNGTRFVDCCQIYGLVVGDAIFPHKSR